MSDPAIMSHVNSIKDRVGMHMILEDVPPYMDPRAILTTHVMYSGFSDVLTMFSMRDFAAESGALPSTAFPQYQYEDDSEDD